MSIRLTESTLRRIVREEARKLVFPHRGLRENADDTELESVKAEFMSSYPQFFRNGGVIRRDERGDVMAYPGGDQSFELNRPFKPAPNRGGVLGQGALVRESASGSVTVEAGVGAWLLGRRLTPKDRDRALTLDGREVVQLAAGDDCLVVGVVKDVHLHMRRQDGTEFRIPVFAVVSGWSFLD